MVETNSAGIVYILTNLAMPGYVKIGKTGTSIEQRVLELSRSSAVPLPFEVYYAAKVSDMNEVENALHDAFGDHRINPKREFFSIAPERVVAILKLLSLGDVTPNKDTGIESKEDSIAMEVARKRRSAFNFKMVNIPAGAVLEFIRDENITCAVAKDRKHVIYGDEVLSVSAAAQKALNSKWQVQGPAYWTYNGELLDELRIRLEGEESEAAYDDYIQSQVDSMNEEMLIAKHSV